ncbi:MAG: substrate-binding domain-containing protein, partial [Sediminibacterium sp.]
VEYASSTSAAFSLAKTAMMQKKYDAIFCMNDTLLLGAWQALQAAESNIDLFGISETDLPSLLPPSISYAHYSGTSSAKATLELMLRVMQEKTPATEKTLPISWHQSKPTII